MPNTQVEILESAARTATGEGSLVDTLKDLVSRPSRFADGTARFFLSVSAASGTSPTLDVDITATVNGVDYVLGSFTQATATGVESITVSACPQDIKAEFTVGGTSPSFTFEVWCSRV